MPQQHTTTSGTGTSSGQIGKEVALGPDAKKKELGDNKLEVEVNGVKFLAHREPNGRIIRDS
jgi:hypothetical protein